MIFFFFFISLRFTFSMRVSTIVELCSQTFSFKAPKKKIIKKAAIFCCSLELCAKHFSANNENCVYAWVARWPCTNDRIHARAEFVRVWIWLAVVILYFIFCLLFAFLFASWLIRVIQKLYVFFFYFCFGDDDDAYHSVLLLSVRIFFPVRILYISVNADLIRYY